MAPAHIRYSKMHGLGNDFMVIDAINQNLAPAPGLIRQWADRRTGVGFDQLLIVEPGNAADAADLSFRIFNADGSESQQCGNGARCVARFAWKNRLIDTSSMRAAAGGRVMQMEALANGHVLVDMGAPSFLPEDIPFRCDRQADGYTMTVAGHRVRVGAVSMGNPHAIMQVDEIDICPVEELGQALQSLPAFPESVNVGFMQIERPRHLRLRVFERGAGETSACGSGACAAFAVARLWNLLETPARVAQRGGVLDIDQEFPGGSIKMTGPAEHVYDGEIEYG